MKFRAGCFKWITIGLFALLVVLLIAQMGSGPGEDVEHKGAFQLGQSIGAGLILCLLLPVIAFFALMAWRNSVGLKTEQRHQEQLAALRREDTNEAR